MADWIKAATSKNKGSFSRAAKKAGESTHAFAEKEKSKGGLMGKRANLALTLGKLRRKSSKS
jgi:hypothetical protein